ncbi:MAG: hypothetical protein HRU15_16170 [Planctomycetes bacterium]|nr:hypothetical protein [Planctomycetota bacterium]
MLRYLHITSLSLCCAVTMLFGLFALPTLSAAEKFSWTAAGKEGKELAEFSEALKKLDAACAKTRKALAGKKESLALMPDVEVYAAGLRLFLETDVASNLNGQKWTTPKIHTTSPEMLRTYIAEGLNRATALAQGKTPWLDNMDQHGVLLGYRSNVDGSIQPYCLYAPPSGYKKGLPLVMWALAQGMDRNEIVFASKSTSNPKAYQIYGGNLMPDAMVVVPPMRWQTTAKFAAHADWLRVQREVERRFATDKRRVVCSGLSQGGSTLWPLAATDGWRYLGVAPSLADFNHPGSYKGNTKKLPKAHQWFAYYYYHQLPRVANYANIPAFVPHDDITHARGGLERTISAMAREGVYASPLISGWHQIPVEDRIEMGRRFQAAEKDRPYHPQQVRVVTHVLRFSRQHWVRIDRQLTPWTRSDVLATFMSDDTIEVFTNNIRSFSLIFENEAPPFGPDVEEAFIRIHGVKYSVGKPGGAGWTVSFEQIDERKNGRIDPPWKQVATPQRGEGLKVPGQSGPIADALHERNIMVLPEHSDKQGDKQGSEPSLMQRWCDYLILDWQRDRRATPLHKHSAAVTDQDIADSHLFLYGTPETNPLMKKVLASPDFPLQWNADSGWTLFDISSKSAVIGMIYPNPLNPQRYVVINGGWGFSGRSGGCHATLLDWAVIKLRYDKKHKWFEANTQQTGLFDGDWKALIKEPWTRGYGDGSLEYDNPFLRIIKPEKKK